MRPTREKIGSDCGLWRTDNLLLKKYHHSSKPCTLRLANTVIWYWPNTVGGTGPIPQANNGLVQFCTQYFHWSVWFFSISPFLIQYWASTALYRTSIGPIHHIRYWSSKRPIPVHYWNYLSILVQYRSNTGSILGQYRFVCTGPVMDQNITSAFGPAQDQCWSNTGTVFLYCPSTDSILGRSRVITYSPIPGAIC